MALLADEEIEKIICQKCDLIRRADRSRYTWRVWRSKRQGGVAHAFPSPPFDDRTVCGSVRRTKENANQL